MALTGKVALVTGASRGIGKGISLQLADAGAIVYGTARTYSPSSKGDALPGSLEETAQEVKARGGKFVPVKCDHTKDEDIEDLFKRIEKEAGRLDILVNNAYSAANSKTSVWDWFGRPFWETPADVWDIINNVGLRNVYLCSRKAAQIMVRQKSGLIVSISSAGATEYDMTPAYGIGKCALDRMASDCGLELQPHNVAFVSLWPGPVRTEALRWLPEWVEKQKSGPQGETAKLGWNAFVGQMDVGSLEKVAESAEFSGICITALATDSTIMSKTRKPFSTAALAKEYNLVDIDGKHIEEFST